MEHHSILRHQAQNPEGESVAYHDNIAPPTQATADSTTFRSRVFPVDQKTSNTPAAIGILWDLDGTLVNSAPLCIGATNHVLRMHGFDKVVEASEYHEGCRYITSRRLAFHATGDPDDTVLGEALGASFDMYYVDLVTTENVSLIPGIRTVLENYAVEKHCVLGVLSNACGKYVRKVCDVHDLNGIFAVKYGADDVFKAKPEPEGLLKCSRDMKVQPNCCLYVGDAVTDALAARAAGMRSIGVSWIDVAYITQEFREAFDVVVTTTDDLQHELDAHISRLANSIPGVSKHSHHKVVWDDSVVDNENAHKYRTDNEYWDGRR